MRKKYYLCKDFEVTNQSQIFLSRYRLFRRVTMDEERFEHPLSTLSASIEHPLGVGGNQVEMREGKSQKSYFLNEFCK